MALAAAPASAQQLQANGTTQSDPANTTRVTAGFGAPGFTYWALNNGTITTVGPVFLTGLDASSVVAQGASFINLGSGSTVRTNNGSSFGLYSSGGSTIVADSVSITTGGDLSWAARLDTAGQMTLNNPTISTSGNGAYGASANGNGSLLVMRGAVISTSGNPNSGTDAAGVVAEFGGQVELTNSALRTSSITTTGNVALGLLSQSGGGTPLSSAILTVTGTPASPITVNTSGANAAGAFVQGGTVTPALMILTDVVIRTTGVGSTGAGALGDGATLRINGGSVTTINDDARGIVSTGSTVIVRRDGAGNGTAVATSGANAFGLLATAGGSIDADGMSVSTSGANANAAVVQNGGTLTVSDSTLKATGPNAAGLFLTSLATLTGKATLTGVVLESSQGPSISVDGGGANIAINSTTATNNNGMWLQVASSDPANPSTAAVTANASTIRGTAITDSASTSNVSLVNGSVWTMTGNSNVTGLTNDASTINYTAPVGDPTQLASFKTLTTKNYAGTGGHIGLNTNLGTDGAPSDRLVIDGGAASGTSSLLITNAGGRGDLTVANGILVVNAVNGGITAPGAFALGAPAVAGPYEYTLYRASIDASGPENWYLRSTLDCRLAPTAIICPQPPVPPVPPGPVPPGPPVPHYRQEVSLYTAMPVMAAVYGRGLIDTLHERMGGDAQLLGPGRDHQPDGAWGRLIGQWGSHDGDPIGIYGSDGPAFDYRYGAVQFGLDLHRKDHEDGKRDNSGVYFALGGAKADVEHSLLGHDIPAGSDDFTAFSIGGYWTRFGANNWYLDSVLQATWYDMEMTANRGLQPGETDGFGLAASLEGGYPFDLGLGWLLEPQAQLVYQAINVSDFNDGAADVRYSDTDSLAGRIGARLSRNWDIAAGTGSTSAPRKLTMWGRADVWHEFLGDPTTEFSSATGFIPFTAELGGTWGKLGVGAAMQLSDVTTLYGNVNYEASFDGDADAWEGKAGLKVQW